MSITDSKKIPGFRRELWAGYNTRTWFEWYSNFSPLEIHETNKGYRVMKDAGHPFKGEYYDTLEEAVYHVRYRAITNFLGDEY